MASVEDFFSNVPIIGGFFESDEEKNLKKQYAQMQAKYQAYRPIAQQAQMGGLRNVLDPRMLGPIQAQMAKMYGPGAAPDPTALMRNPLEAAQLQAGNAQLAEQQALAARQKAIGDQFMRTGPAFAPRPQMPFGNVGGR